MRWQYKRHLTLLILFAAFVVMSVPPPVKAEEAGGLYSQSGNMFDATKSCDSNSSTSLLEDVAPGAKNSNCMACLQADADRLAQQRMAKAQGVFKNVPVLDAKSCIGQIDTFFTSVSGLMNGLTSMLYNLIMGFIKDALNQVCNLVMGAIQGLMSAITSALCIPIPGGSLYMSANLGMNLGGGGCSGIPLMGMTARNGMSTPFYSTQQLQPLFSQ